MDYILKSSDERVVINDFVQGDPLSEENLDRTLELVSNLRKVDSANPCKMGVPDVENPNEIRLLMPEKTIWIYTGYKLKFNEWFADKQPFSFSPKQNDGEGLMNDFIRCEIVKSIDVLVDGQYIDSQRNISAKWRGSDNQRVIDVQESLKQGEIVLWCD